jgi:succinate-semialdehyde dehydrogenase/glutarate-semialdehyde dehydrogenase
MPLAATDASSTRSSIESINPATGELVGSVTVATPDEVRAAVSRARAAQPAWEALSLDERVAKLLPAGPALLDRAEELGELLCREMGKPLAEATGEVRACAANWEAELREIADALKPQIVEDGSTRSTVYRDPLGVCAAITPWNFPMLMPHWLLLPALVAGNTVVFKPSEETPLIAQAYADALAACLPGDVLITVHGADEQGKALVAADVDLIVFTGSREVGKKIMAEAAGGLKRVLLELGGKDPLLVLDGADLDAAATFAARNAFRNAGQVCVSTERIYVSEALHDDFVEKLRAESAKLIVGDGMAKGTAIGPMINAGQRDHVLRQIDRAAKDGATVIVADGADTPSGEGNFLRPTILTNVTHDMEVAMEESFGPIVTVTKTATDDQAISLANDTPYGLGAAVFGDPERARLAARRIKAGMVGINKGLGGASGTPWVGMKQSGIGFHSGPEGHRQFAQIRVVSEAK